MPIHPNERTIDALKRIVEQIEYLVQHPRIQQKTWVASGREWLPVLLHAIEDLTELGNNTLPLLEESTSSIASIQPITAEVETPMLLIKVSEGSSETYVNISLNDITKVTVDRNGEPNHRYQRGAMNSFELKNGRKYMTIKTEALRIIEALREREEGNKS